MPRPEAALHTATPPVDHSAALEDCSSLEDGRIDRGIIQEVEIQTPTKISSNVAFISNQALQQNPTVLCCSCAAGEFHLTHITGRCFLCCQGVRFLLDTGCSNNWPKLT